MSNSKVYLVNQAVNGFVNAINANNTTWTQYWLGVLEYRLREAS